MAVFKYKVRDKDNQILEGKLEATTEKEAADVLKSKGYWIASLNKESVGSFFGLSKYKKPKEDELVNFTRQLSTMINSGLTLIDALRILKNQAPPAMAQVIDKTLIEIESGKSFSQALEATEDVFSSVYIALVRVGESAGLLDNILKKLAESMESEREFRNKTKGALVYPAIVVVGMVVVVTIMMIFVIPKMTEMYDDMGIDLPTMTRILIGVSDFMAHYWYLLFGLVALLISSFKKWAKTELGGMITEQIAFKIPVWGKLKEDMILAKFARTMGLLIASGISVIEALRIVGDTLGSRIYKEGLIQVMGRVEKGVSLAESMSMIEEFPSILPQMISVGEQTGKVDEVLTRLAIYYEAESAQKIKTLTTAIEPLIMVVMGVGVGFLVAAVILPIYNLTSQF